MGITLIPKTTEPTRDDSQVETVYCNLQEFLIYAFENERAGILRMKYEEIPESPYEIPESQGIFDHENYFHKFFTNGITNFGLEYGEDPDRKYVFVWVSTTVFKEFVETKIKEQEQKECKVKIQSVIETTAVYKSTIEEGGRETHASQ